MRSKRSTESSLNPGQALAKFSLNELTNQADVSTRTVRYYITEGLLPPPVVAGARSYYTEDHLNRLRLIAYLKGAYLPLKEIRKRLTGLEPDDVAAEIALLESPDGFEASMSAPMPQLREENAVDYLNTIMQRSAARAVPGRPNRQHLPRAHQVRLQSSNNASREQWRKIELNDDAEFLIREEAYQRDRERIDWLIDWAKKVFH